MIYIIGYLEQTGKKIAVNLMKSNFLHFFQKNAWKRNFVKKTTKQKTIKSILNRWGMIMHSILVKFTLYPTE